LEERSPDKKWRNKGKLRRRKVHRSRDALSLKHNRRFIRQYLTNIGAFYGANRSFSSIATAIAARQSGAVAGAAFNRQLQDPGRRAAGREAQVGDTIESGLLPGTNVP
jgi:hypothetical protein